MCSITVYIHTHTHTHTHTEHLSSINTSVVSVDYLNQLHNHAQMHNHAHCENLPSAKYVGGFPRTPEGKIDYAEDFFSKPAYLTVSGQLNGEMYACSLSNVYTFGAAGGLPWLHAFAICTACGTFACVHLAYWPLKAKVCMPLCLW